MILKEFEVYTDVDDFIGRTSIWFDLGAAVFTPGMIGLLLCQTIEDETLHLLVMLIGITYLIDFFACILWIQEMARFMVENRSACNGRLWLVLTLMGFAILPLVIVSLSVATFIVDKENIMMPYTVYVFFLPIF